MNAGMIAMYAGIAAGASFKGSLNSSYSATMVSAACGAGAANQHVSNNSGSNIEQVDNSSTQNMNQIEASEAVNINTIDGNNITITGEDNAAGE
jgi:hypothetical protein